MEALSAAVKERFGFEPSIDNQFADREVLVEKLWGELEKIIEARESEFSLPVFLYFARYFYQEEIDQRWIDHLKAMEALREGIGLRGYGQKDPKQEYKKEGFVIFGEMMGIIGRNVCEKLFHMQLRREESSAAEVQVPQTQRRKARRTIESGGGAAAQSAGAGGNGAPGEGEARPVRRHEPKVGRNDPCPCGSGKKYKKCHGAVVAA
jgi:preprotein translocase subunit SecA